MQDLPSSSQGLNPQLVQLRGEVSFPPLSCTTPGAHLWFHPYLGVRGTLRPIGKREQRQWLIGAHLLTWGVGCFPGGASGKASTCQCRRCKRHRFDPWVGKIPWSRESHTILVFLPQTEELGELQSWGHKESDPAEWHCLTVYLLRPGKDIAAKLGCVWSARGGGNRQAGATDWGKCQAVAVDWNQEKAIDLSVLSLGYRRSPMLGHGFSGGVPPSAHGGRSWGVGWGWLHPCPSLNNGTHIGS